MAKYGWKLNANSENALCLYCDIAPNQRIWKNRASNWYHAEFWGDYSFDFPRRRGPFSTMQHAVKASHDMARA